MNQSLSLEKLNPKNKKKKSEGIITYDHGLILWTHFYSSNFIIKFICQLSMIGMSIFLSWIGLKCVFNHIHRITLGFFFFFFPSLFPTYEIRVIINAYSSGNNMCPFAFYQLGIKTSFNNQILVVWLNRNVEVKRRLLYYIIDVYMTFTKDIYNVYIYIYNYIIKEDELFYYSYFFTWFNQVILAL